MNEGRAWRNCFYFVTAATCATAVLCCSLTMRSPSASTIRTRNYRTGIRIWRIDGEAGNAAEIVPDPIPAAHRLVAAEDDALAGAGLKGRKELDAVIGRLNARRRMLSLPLREITGEEKAMWMVEAPLGFGDLFPGQPAAQP
jgi:hypothetical protein